MIAEEMFDIAQSVLQSRNLGENVYLTPLKRMIESGKNLATRMVEKFPGFEKKQLPQLLQWIKQIESGGKS